MPLIQPPQSLRGFRLAPPATALVLLIAALGLAGCDRAGTSAQGYPSLEPLDKLLAEADSAFSGPIPD